MRDTLNELQIAIEHETCRVIGARFHLQNQNNERDRRMAIEIKGLRADALTARSNIDRLRTAYAKFNEAAPAHAADIEGLAAQVGGMQSDLEFAATVMGNSAGESEKLAQERSEKQTVTTADTAKIAAEPIVAQQTAAQTDRGALGPHPDQPAASPEVEQIDPATFRAAE